MGIKDIEMYKQIITWILVMLFTLSSVALAERRVIEVDTRNLSQSQLDYLNSLSNNAINPKIKEAINPDTMAKWAEIGKGIATSLSAACKELSIGVNDFVKTPVGKLTTALIVWQVVGKDIWHIILGMLLFFTMTPLVIGSFLYFHTNKKVKLADGKIEYVERFRWSGNNGRVGSAWGHVIFLIIIILISFLIAA